MPASTPTPAQKRRRQLIVRSRTARDFLREGGAAFGTSVAVFTTVEVRTSGPWRRTSLPSVTTNFVHSPVGQERQAEL